LDRLDVGILGEMIANPNARSADISNKYNTPLSIIQRRRLRLEKAVLRKSYQVNLRQFGWRTADLLIHVENANCEHVAEIVLSKYSNFIASTSLRIGSPEVNVMAEAFYLNSQDLHDLIENIKAIPAVTAVDWSEVVKVIDSDNLAMINTLFGRAG
jgi:DNA-binding Lrp family transcriptional regulator